MHLCDEGGGDGHLEWRPLRVMLFHSVNLWCPLCVCACSLIVPIRRLPFQCPFLVVLGPLYTWNRLSQTHPTSVAGNPQWVTRNPCIHQPHNSICRLELFGLFVKETAGRSSVCKIPRGRPNVPRSVGDRKVRNRILASMTPHIWWMDVQIPIIHNYKKEMNPVVYYDTESYKRERREWERDKIGQMKWTTSHRRYLNKHHRLCIVVWWAHYNTDVRLSPREC